MVSHTGADRAGQTVAILCEASFLDPQLEPLRKDKNCCV